MADEKLEVQITAEDKASKVISNIGNVAGGILKAGMLGATAAVAGLAAGLGFAISEAAEAQDIDTKLAQAIANTGDVTGVTTGMVDALATEYGNLTRYEDDTIKAAATVMARFDNINKDTFPTAMTTAMDLSTALGIDLSQAALMVGKALETPGEGLMRLKAAGVVFTDEQTAMIQKMAETGDAAGAQQLILQALNETVGGQALAAGQTFTGQMEIMKNTLGNVAESIGTAVLPMVQNLLSGLVTFVQSDQFQGWIQQIATWLQTYLPIAIQFLVDTWNTVFLPAIQAVWGWLSTVFIPFLQTVVFPWLQTYIPVALQFLSNVWTTVLQPAIQAVWTWLSTVLIPFLQNVVFPWLQENIPKALAFLGDVWENVLKPAIEAVWSWMSTVLIPFLQNTVFPWLQENIPAAIQVLSDFWTNTLWPAIQAVWNWMSSVLIPFLSTTLTGIFDIVGSALTTLANFWSETLWPAIQIVWDFISTYVIPLLQALSDLITTVLGVALTALAGLWENVLQPALQAVWDFISASLNPIIQTLTDMFNNTLGPALDTAGGALDTLKGIFDGIGGAIEGVIGWIGDMIDKLSNIDLPDWLTPGSPTPFEMGLRGITTAMKDMVRVGMPTLQTSLQTAGVGAMATYNQTRQTYINLTANYPYQSQEDVASSIKTLSLMYGVS